MHEVDASARVVDHKVGEFDALAEVGGLDEVLVVHASIAEVIPDHDLVRNPHADDGRLHRYTFHRVARTVLALWG
ncbi:MAG: hypothetical protein P8M16_10345, partial [Acidimicrobiales bacterium]|nr:hypothetical protein [Acidimicrobiales bacterium]